MLETGSLATLQRTVLPKGQRKLPGKRLRTVAGRNRTSWRDERIGVNSCAARRLHHELPASGTASACGTTLRRRCFKAE
jgi:hypothetical protein